MDKGTVSQNKKLEIGDNTVISLSFLAIILAAAYFIYKADSKADDALRRLESQKEEIVQNRRDITAVSTGIGNKLDTLNTQVGVLTGQMGILIKTINERKE